MNYIPIVEDSITKATQEISNMTKEILEMEGMSGKYTRHFYNNLCSIPNAKYLEIGVWKGSSFCSALCNNNMSSCLAIDNWSEFGGPKDEFIKNLDKVKGNNNVKFVEQDCFTISEEDRALLGKFNIFMYDGNHSEDAQYRALQHFLPCLEDEFIYIVDDWNWEAVRAGNMEVYQQ